MTAEQLIQQLELQPHPEGGFYKEIYRSEATIEASCLPPPFDGTRHFCTSIYYLLQGDDFSAFHRIKSDELWHFYAGGSLVLHLLHETYGYQSLLLGNNLTEGARFFILMPAGVWFAAEPEKSSEFTLAGCTVSPGFDFRDFEMAKRENLVLRFPEKWELIERLCR